MPRQANWTDIEACADALIWDLKILRPPDGQEASDHYRAIRSTIQAGFERKWFITRAFFPIVGFSDSIAELSRSSVLKDEAEAFAIHSAIIDRSFGVPGEFVSLELITRLYGTLRRIHARFDQIDHPRKERFGDAITKSLNAIRTGNVLASIHYCAPLELREVLAKRGCTTDDDILRWSSEIFEPCKDRLQGVTAGGRARILGHMLEADAKGLSRWRYCRSMADAMVAGINARSADKPRLMVQDLFSDSARSGPRAGKGTAGLSPQDGHICQPVAPSLPSPATTES